MPLTLEHPDACIRIEELPPGRRLLSVRPRTDRATFPPASWQTAYSPALIESILRAKGPAALIDEICRDEDPAYVQACLQADLFCYVPPDRFARRRLLDFGCGAGASSLILARLLPHAAITGIDLDDRFLDLARARAAHYGCRHLQFLRSPSPDCLPDGLGVFDFIVLSAVYEHLLPEERRRLLPALWSALTPGGVLFLNQTPWRWFPFEGHTSRLPLINYLPDRLALACARLGSRRVRPDETWTQLLRRGIRGGSVREVLRLLRTVGDPAPVLLQPAQPGMHDRIDVWYAGYAAAISHKYPWARSLQRLLRRLCKAVRCTTGMVLLPSLSLALQKPAAACSTPHGQAAPRPALPV